MTSVTEYRLDLFEKQPDGSWTQKLMERFDGPFTAEVLTMVAHETGYGHAGRSIRNKDMHVPFSDED